ELAPLLELEPSLDPNKLFIHLIITSVLCLYYLL
ncbi:MAG: hypothetical protein ACI902_002191, partial [Psychroserpens sp.]